MSRIVLDVSGVIRIDRLYYSEPFLDVIIKTSHHKAKATGGFRILYVDFGFPIHLLIHTSACPSKKDGALSKW